MPGMKSRPEGRGSKVKTMHGSGTSDTRLREVLVRVVPKGADVPEDPDRTRKLVALGLNAIAPGAGLIVLRREWLGVVLALLFVVLLQMSLWGLFIVPEEFAGPATWTSLVAAVGVWLAAQGMGVARARVVLGTEARQQQQVLLEQAVLDLEQARLADARELLLIALALNDEDPQARRLWARLMMLVGNFQAARRGWEAVLKLDRAGEFFEEASAALEELPEN